jgi:hypothetical protein
MSRDPSRPSLAFLQVSGASGIGKPMEKIVFGFLGAYRLNRACARARQRLRRARTKHGLWERLRDSPLIVRPELGLLAIGVLTLGFMIFQWSTESTDKPEILGLTVDVRRVGGDDGPATSTGVPTGGRIEYRLRARNLGNVTMHEAAAVLNAPRGIQLLLGSCSAKAGENSQVPCRISGYALHVEDAALGAGQMLEVSVKGELHKELGPAGQVAIASAASEEAPETFRKAVVYPQPSMGWRAFQNYYRHEVNGRLHWREMVKAVGVGEFISSRWHRLTPYGLHGVKGFREALHARFGQLFDDEGLAAKIVVVRATIHGQPLRGRGRLAPGSHELVRRERIPLSEDGHRLAWCTTTIRAAHALRPGDHVLVVAIIVAWGIVYPNGHAVAAVMMVCPAVRVLASARSMPDVPRMRGVTGANGGVGVSTEAP